MKTLKIEGMTCGGCSRSVTRALEKAGVTVASVSHHDGTAQVGDDTDLAAATKAVEKAGFTVAATTQA